MSTVLQIILILSAAWITNGRHLRREHEKVFVQEFEKNHKFKRESNEIAGEKPPAPVIEVIEGEKSDTKPFLSSPSPELFRIPLEANIVTRSSVMNTDITGALEKENMPPIYGELPVKDYPIPEELLITPSPKPVVPIPEPITPVLPQPTPITVPVQPISVPPPVTPLPLPPIQRPNFLVSQPITQVRPVVPPPQAAPVAPLAPVAVVPPPAPPPVAPVAPVAPVPPSPPPQEPPVMTPSRYAVYLGDMFLKLMTQLLSRARLTLSRLTGPPPVSPEIAESG